jgi:hypothetical protein
MKLISHPLNLRPKGPRKGESSATLCDKPTWRMHEPSQRQLPTDLVHDGGLKARSTNNSLINRRFFLSVFDLMGDFFFKSRAGPGFSLLQINST